MANRLDPINLADFTGGLDLRSNQFQLAANQSPEMENITIDPLDITCALALGGLWFFVFTQQLKTRSLLPIKEPALKEALGHG